MSRIVNIDQAQDLTEPTNRQQKYLQELHGLNPEQARLLMDIRDPEKPGLPMERPAHGVRKVTKWLGLEAQVCRERSV